jgi:hypothetical protein
MTEPLDYKALCARWENFINKPHGPLNVTQAEGLIYTDDPTVVAAEIVRQAGIDDPEVVAAIRDIRIKVAQKKARRARYGEMIALLEDKHAVTGNPRFGAAMEAIKERGFGRQHAGTWRTRKKQDERVYVARMHDILEQKEAPSIRTAAARVAVEFWIPGASFEAIVKRLDRAYRRAKPILIGRRRAAKHRVLFGEISEVWTNRRRT